jgi:DNA polymerase III alpha subunit (gram-positive type)
MRREIVFVDIETSGLKPSDHAVIQIAAVACTLPDLQIIDSLEFKIKFRADKADPVALAHNTYARQVSIPESIVTALDERYSSLEWFQKQDQNVVQGLLSPDERDVFFQNHQLWQVEAYTPSEGEKMLTAFLKRHATVGKTSKMGKIYNVATLAGHNIATFDMPFLQEWYRRMDNGAGRFFPAEYFPLDTLQMAVAAKNLLGIDYPDFKLETLCRWHGVAELQNHDALDDVYLNIALARVLHHKIYIDNHVSAEYVNVNQLGQGLPDHMRELINE